MRSKSLNEALQFNGIDVKSFVHQMTVLDFMRIGRVPDTADKIMAHCRRKSLIS
jgi:uncharacterized protein with GYD domain